MFERFTGRARHVVVLSQEEARLLNHNYIGTEHILLGLLGEPESVAGTVLAGFGLTRDGVREEVVEKVGRGKKALAGHIPFTPRAKKTLELSLREAIAIKHNYIGTEHILLGLIREGDGVAVQILQAHADPVEIRAAVLDAVAASNPAEAADTAEGTDETNAVLRWLRHRLSRQAVAVPFRPENLLGSDAPRRGTPAVEAALQQAAKLAGPRPVGSHHLLLAALDDPESAASGALASLGVPLDELRAKLRAANVAGTTDEQPEQAGRRQMALEVSDEILTIVLTDPEIVEAANEALRAVNAREAALQAKETEPASPAGPAPAATPAKVIRGDHPAAANLANVWLELRKTLSTLASVSPVTPDGKPSDDTPAEGEPEGPGEAGGEAPAAGEETA